MQNLSIESMRSGATRLLMLQLLITAIITVIATCLAGIPVAYSVLVGGAICVLANFFFVKRFFAFSGARAGRKIIQMMYCAEIIKLVISSLFFLLAIQFWHVLPLPFLVSYFIVQSTHWLTPWVFKNNRLVI